MTSVATTSRAAAIAALRSLGVAPDAYGPTVNTARSPRDVDVIGEGLADEFGTRAAAAPQALVVWDTSDEAVLAHAVARRLGIGVLRASEDEGRLGLDRDLEPGTPVALLATRWDGRRLASLRKLVGSRGGEVVAVAAALDSGALADVRDVPTATLVAGDEAEGYFS
jgi:hypothetical protein